MTAPPNCDAIRDLLELYALGALDPADRETVQAHLDSGCAACAAELHAAARFNAAVLAALPPGAEPSAAVRQQLMDAVRPAGRPASRPIPWPWLGVATTLAASLLFCFFSLNRERDRAAVLAQELNRVRSESQQLRAAFAFLQNPETRPVTATPGPQPPRGTYFVNPGGVLLIASNLPALSAGQTYQMWLIPRAGAPLPAGLFRAGTSGSAVHFAAQPVDVPQTAALAISVEPDAGSPAPTSTPLLVTKL